MDKNSIHSAGKFETYNMQVNGRQPFRYMIMWTAWTQTIPVKRRPRASPTDLTSCVLKTGSILVSKHPNGRIGYNYPSG